MRQLVGAYSGSVTTVTGSLAGSTVLAASDSRFALKFHNLSNGDVLIGYLSASTPAMQVSPSNNITLKLAASASYDDPHRYTGPLSVCWLTLPSTGSLFITEMF